MAKTKKIKNHASISLKAFFLFYIFIKQICNKVDVYGAEKILFKYIWGAKILWRNINSIIRLSLFIKRLDSIYVLLYYTGCGVQYCVL